MYCRPADLFKIMVGMNEGAMMNTTKARGMRILLSLILVGSALIAVVKPASAATLIVVTTTLDENGNGSDCALREAIMAANTNKAVGGCPSGVAAGTALSSPYDIYLPAGIYNLTIPGSVADEFNKGEFSPEKGDLNISGAITIRGAGMDDSTIRSTTGSRVLYILNANAVNISNVGITGGFNGVAPDPVSDGGGLLIYSSNVNLRFVKVYGNTPNGGGGGINIRGTSAVYIDRSEITNNTAQSAAGINNDGVSLTIERSAIYQNTANPATGSANGAVSASSGTTWVVNSTIAKNTAPSPGGGGVTVAGGAALYLLNDTIADNSGAGLDINGGGWIKNTIVARPAPGYPNCQVNRQGFVSLGHNAFGGTECNILKVSFDKNVTPSEETTYLDSILQPNGGLTLNYALPNDPANANASPFVDAGDNAGCPNVDQRFLSRPAIGKVGITITPVCDIGAFELFGTPLTQNLFLPQVRR